MGWYHLGGLAPTQDWEMAILALGDSCSSSTLGFVYGYTEGGGRTIFCFVFTLTASFWEAMHYKLCLYVNRLWSWVCSFGAWFSELELVCLKKAQKRWKLVLRFQPVKRRSLSDDLFSLHFEIKSVFVGCPKKNKKKCWFLPTAADSLCANLMSHPSCSDVGVKKAPA